MVSRCGARGFCVSHAWRLARRGAVEGCGAGAGGGRCCAGALAAAARTRHEFPLVIWTAPPMRFPSHARAACVAECVLAARCGLPGWARQREGHGGQSRPVSVSPARPLPRRVHARARAPAVTQAARVSCCIASVSSVALSV